MSKKIGILTFHNGPNYGGFMQAWHMRNIVRTLGYECDVINYLHQVHVESNKVQGKVRNIADLKARIHWMIKTRPFQEPIRELSEMSFCDDATNVPWEDYSGIVVGSDVIFDFENPKFGSDPCYFGAHPSQASVPFMSYAASCGMAEVEGAIPDYCNGLKRFKALGVRDYATKTLVEKITGIIPEMNVDPTWLAPDPNDQDWNRPKGKYILLYGRRMPKVWAPHLSDYCKKRGLQIVSAGNPNACADKVYRSLSPFQWTELFRGAEATVIGTLHGTMYSIKYGKPFILINNDVIRQKVKEAVDLTGMGFRRVEQSDLRPAHLSLLDRDTSPLPEIPTEWKARSIRFLQDGISNMVSQPLG
jgi:hypothetical protein